ncbi:MAG: hypothetical protein OEU84_17050 [Xanthomonadales bacterium]|nr:hypothetical protein [Xanthomonadales bacterium]MDH4021303.1 hypothetical protein [Xanthomonadales bacterium]
MKNLLAIVSLFIFCGLANAANNNPSTHWDRSSAMAAVRSVNIDIAVSEIGNVSSLADGKTTVTRLRQLETRSDWPLPAREAAVLQFTRSLAELPRAAVADEVMQHLIHYKAQTLVPHEDHANALVPLFNIRGAATGVENGWQREEFTIEAIEVLETNPTDLVSAYIDAAGHTQRSGYLDALRQASMYEVEAVQNAVLEQLVQSPELTPMIGLTAEITTDTFAVQELLINGRGAGLSATLKQLGRRLPVSETATLLEFAILEAPAGNASLAIAAWWPGLRHDGVLRDLLMDKLADPALGATAALALAQNPDILTIKILQDTANGDSVAARRAQMALDINRDRLIGENQR